MDIVYFALPIKNYLIKELSPLGWATLISRCLPELLETNPRFSASRINKNTKFSEIEIKIIQHYLRKMYDKRIPTDYLYDHAEIDTNYWDLVGLNFLSSTNYFHKIKNKILNLFTVRQ
jgi:hypothetical protein